MQNIISFASFKRDEVSEEENLIKKAQKGDTKAFAMVIKEYKNSLYKIAYSYVKDEEKALDILSETTYKGMVNIKKLKDKKLFKTWITRILINIAINEMKKESRVIYIEDDNPLIEDEKSEIKCERLDLYTALDKLKPVYKTALMLRYFDDMTIDEIAQIMEIPVNTVKSHLRRGKDAIKVYLGEEYGYGY